MSLQGGEKELRGERGKAAMGAMKEVGCFHPAQGLHWVDFNSFSPSGQLWSRLPPSTGVLNVCTMETLGVLAGCHSLLLSAVNHQSPRGQPGHHLKAEETKSLKGNLQPNWKP